MNLVLSPVFSLHLLLCYMTIQRKLILFGNILRSHILIWRSCTRGVSGTCWTHTQVIRCSRCQKALRMRPSVNNLRSSLVLEVGMPWTRKENADSWLLPMKPPQSFLVVSSTSQLVVWGSSLGWARRGWYRWGREGRDGVWCDGRGKEGEKVSGREGEEAGGCLSGLSFFSVGGLVRVFRWLKVMSESFGVHNCS